MSAIDDARRVAADLLRQAGDETGARVVENAQALLDTADAITKLTGRTEATIGGMPMESLVEAVQRVVTERDRFRDGMYWAQDAFRLRTRTSNSTD